jgi:hypothetical protein
VSTRENFLATLLNWYLFPRKFEANGAIYKFLGVKMFVKITPYELLARFEGRRRWSLNKRGMLKKYFKDSVAGEVAHFFSFLFLLAIVISLLSEGVIFWGMAVLLLNILINLYPIFLMRFNRLRIAKALGRPAEELIAEL